MFSTDECFLTQLRHPVDTMGLFLPVQLLFMLLRGILLVSNSTYFSNVFKI